MNLPKRIMLLCSAGMSTSLLARRMQAIADEKGGGLKIWSSSEVESKRYLNQVDVILLGPQVRHLRRRIENQLVGLPVRVGVIDPVQYGRMEVDKILAQALALTEGSS